MPRAMRSRRTLWAEKTEVFRDWLDTLKHRAARGRILVSVDRLIHGDPIGQELSGVGRCAKESRQKSIPDKVHV